MLEHTKATLQQHESFSKSPYSSLRFVDEKHIEDIKVNIGAMDPQCSHLASRFLYKVFVEYFHPLFALNRALEIKH